MTPDERLELDTLKGAVNRQQEFIDSLKSSDLIPLDLDQALEGRGFLKVILPVAVNKGGTNLTTATGYLLFSTTNIPTQIAPLSGSKTYYVSDTSGGGVTRKLTFTSGVLTAEV